MPKIFQLFQASGPLYYTGLVTTTQTKFGQNARLFANK